MDPLKELATMVDEAVPEDTIIGYNLYSDGLFLGFWDIDAANAQGFGPW